MMKVHRFYRHLWALVLSPALLGACAKDGAVVPLSQGAAKDSPLARGLASIRGEDIAEHVAILASDRFEGRFPGTAGETKTVAYISAQLARSGVLPALDGAYLQDVPLVAVTPDPSMSLAMQGPEGALALRYAEDFVASASQAAPLAAVKDSSVVFAGYGIVAPEYGWNDYEGVDVRGKTVIVLQNDPGAKRGDEKFFKGRSLSYYGTFPHKAEEAARRGAAAIFAIHDAGLSGVDWSVISKSAGQTKYKLASGVESEAPEVQGLVRQESAKALFKAAGQDLAALAEQAGAGGFRARALPISLRIEVQSKVRSVLSHNVIGVLPGQSKPDEYVIYTAHWDHIGTSESKEGDRIFNGAVDNATGTAALLDLARAYAAAGTRPARSIVFIATTAEEQGLLGAKYYAERPVYPLANTVAVINMDALFPFGETRGMTVVGLGSSELEEYMGRAALGVGRKLYADPTPEQGAFFRSDHYPFARKGVPAIFAVGGPAEEEGVGETVDVKRYSDYMKRYHQTSDEYDPRSWDMGGIVQDVKIYFQTGYEIATDERFPNWYPGHEFRARRDAMRAKVAAPH